MSQVENAMPPLPLSSDPAQSRAFSWPATWVALLSLAAVINGVMVFLTHGTHGYFTFALAVTVCTLAALHDGFTCRIPNQLTYTAALLGLSINALASLLLKSNAGVVVTWLGAPGLLDSLLGFGVCFLLGLAASTMAGIHGGDLKLFAALGAILGLSATAVVAFVALTLALIYALINLTFSGRLTLAWRIGAQCALELAYFRKFHSLVPDTIPASHIPMAVPMGVSMIGILCLQITHGGRTVW